VLTLLTRRCDCPGNSAVIGLRAVRPEVLRPRLSTGLLFVTPGDGSTTLHIVHAACQQSNILILLKVTAWPRTWWGGHGREFVCLSRQVLVRVFSVRGQLDVFYEENEVADRRQRKYGKCEPVFLTVLERPETATKPHSRECLQMATAAGLAIRRAAVPTVNSRGASACARPKTFRGFSSGGSGPAIPRDYLRCTVPRLPSTQGAGPHGALTSEGRDVSQTGILGRLHWHE
jgi:hypothetical protein